MQQFQAFYLRIAVAVTMAPAAVQARPSADDERGASLVEYALLVALIALACVAAIGLLGTTTGDSLSKSSSSMFG